jgi:hypothetical protein
MPEKFVLILIPNNFGGFLFTCLQSINAFLFVRILFLILRILLPNFSDLEKDLLKCGNANSITLDSQLSLLGIHLIEEFWESIDLFHGKLQGDLSGDVASDLAVRNVLRDEGDNWD